MNADKQNINAYKRAMQNNSGDASDTDDDWLLQLAANDNIETRKNTPKNANTQKSANTQNLDLSGEKNKKEAAGAPLSFEEKARSFAKLPAGGAAEPFDEENESKYRRVAKFLILIGAEQAAKVLSNLEEEQVEKISAEIAGIKGINKDEASTIFAEFQGILAQNYGTGATGGMEEARKLLYTAFGKDKGDEFLRRAVPQYRETSFTFLEGFSG